MALSLFMSEKTLQQPMQLNMNGMCAKIYENKYVLFDSISSQIEFYRNMTYIMYITPFKWPT